MFNQQYRRPGSMEMSRKYWGSSLGTSTDFDYDEPSVQSLCDLERTRSLEGAVPRPMLDETQQSWLLEPKVEKKEPMVDLGCVSVTRRFFRWMNCIFWGIVVIIALALIIWKFGPKHGHSPPKPDNYTIALSKALSFFDIQKSGALPVNDRQRRFKWRRSSALLDGQAAQPGSPAVKLAGGFYDGGNTIKFGFPGAYAMTMLSWSVIEYKAKFEASGEFDHARELIKWGTDYILKTFNNTEVDKIICQVGIGGGPRPNDLYCWERPEDLDFFKDTRRSAISVNSGSDLAAEMAAALSAASIVFRDDPKYSQGLVNAAKALYAFAKLKPGSFVQNLPGPERAIYNATSFNDELIWGSTWLYFATGNTTYLGDATIRSIENSNRKRGYTFGVFDWDNKLVGAQLLLTRLRILQGPGYPYEQTLKQYNNETNLVMCAYLPQFRTWNRTKGGMILFNPNATQHLPTAVNAAFLATLYADYLKAADVPVLECGPNWYSPEVLRNFSRSQVDYALGKNPLKTSYIVGYSEKYPLQPRHRAASIPDDGKSYSCEQGWQWRDRNFPNPHVLQGALVGGPDILDRFTDLRKNYIQNEPTIANNAGLVGALVALSTMPTGTQEHIDPHSIFSAIPVYVPSPPPPVVPWEP